MRALLRLASEIQQAFPWMPYPDLSGTLFQNYTEYLSG